MKAIKFSMQVLSDASLGITPEEGGALASFAHFSLTEAYSILTYAAESKEKQAEYAEKTLYHAKRCEDIASKYESGLIVLRAHRGSYIAYKTLADIAESDRKKIEM